MDFPVITKQAVFLPDARVDVDVVKLEFTNLIFVVLSTTGKFGDMVLFERQAPNAMGFPPFKSSSFYDSRMLLGCDRDESHLLAKKVATELRSDKNVIVSSTFPTPISYSDATEICKVLVSA
uniref:Proteasome assembly chaperone 3 n=1 Tax=Mesocestoides corti TaxID=53468 RepID=A0A5K3EMF8_MESCO